tara:strand:+ start:155 stop:340 length:186 start_codon:yes stop_codon:yes gene_type:complete
MNSEYKKVRDDLEYYFELDLDNCGMTHKDWINEITLLIITNDYKYELLSQLSEYKRIRREL